MYISRLVALSLLLSVTPAAARDRASNHSISSAESPRMANARAQAVDHYGSPGPSSARMPLDTNMDLGVGIYSVGGHFVRDRQRNGREPILGTSGRDNRIAAVGLSLRF
jgi:hypothetical protein